MDQDLALGIVRIRVIGSVILRALWEKSYLKLWILIGGIAFTVISVLTFFIIKKRRVGTLPKPSEIDKIEKYMEKLERLRGRGKISEEAYSRLKAEYEEKLKKLKRGY